MLLVTREIVDEFLRTFRRGGMPRCSNKPFDFCADPDRDTDPGIIVGIFTTAGYGIFFKKNVAGSAASAEVCGLRGLILFIYLFIQ